MSKCASVTQFTTLPCEAAIALTWCVPYLFPGVVIITLYLGIICITQSLLFNNKHMSADMVWDGMYFFKKAWTQFSCGWGEIQILSCVCCLYFCLGVELWSLNPGKTHLMVSSSCVLFHEDNRFWKSGTTTSIMEKHLCTNKYRILQLLRSIAGWR